MSDTCRDLICVRFYHLSVRPPSRSTKINTQEVDTPCYNTRFGLTLPIRIPTLQYISILRDVCLLEPERELNESRRGYAHTPNQQSRSTLPTAYVRYHSTKFNVQRSQLHSGHTGPTQRSFQDHASKGPARGYSHQVQGIKAPRNLNVINTSLGHPEKVLRSFNNNWPNTHTHTRSLYYPY